MSERRHIACDGCGKTLPLPTNRWAAEGWEKLSKTYNNQHRDLHWCGTCPNRQGIVERLDVWKPEDLEASHDA